MKHSDEEMALIKAHDMRYALRNRTQFLIMKEVVWYHELVFNKGQIRFWNDWFRLKLYLYKKYKITF